MTDYERVTTRETTAVDPAVDPMTASPAVASTVRTTDRAYVAAGPSGATTAARIVTFAFGILQVLLILRIVLLLLVANPGNGLVDAIFSITQPFVEPFINMFSLDKVTSGASVLDVAAIVALIAWTLVEALILAGLRIFQPRRAEAI
jgi:uncharacterized protein YggT (Ycf19 family)